MKYGNHNIFSTEDNLSMSSPEKIKQVSQSVTTSYEFCTKEPVYSYVFVYNKLPWCHHK